MTSFMPENLPEPPEAFPQPGASASSPSAPQFAPSPQSPQAARTPQVPAVGRPVTGQQPLQRQPFIPQQPAQAPTHQAPSVAQPQQPTYGQPVPTAPAASASGQVASQQPGAARPSHMRQAPAASGPAAGGARLGMSQEKQDGDLDLESCLRAMLAAGASDLHITSGAPPMIRVDGALRPIEGMPKQTPEGIQRSLFSIITQKQRETFDEHLELDFSYSLIGESRFRVNMYRQRNAVGAAFRVIPYEIKPLEALGVPEAVSKFAHLPRGLVLVTGPTGSGKSTTLASLVDLANRSRSGHIMTVEDPIEFLHRHKRSLVNQREVGADTKSFANALKHVLRQDPDIILIGELRDLETIQVALTAAETGHLVFATLHTQDAAQTIDRVIDVFPAEQQGQVRTQLASAIQGVVCQALLPRADTSGRAVSIELMVATPGIRNLIREGKTHQIHTAMQAGASLGMQSMDQHLAELVKAGTVSFDVAAELCHSYEEFNRLCGRAGARAQ